MLWGGTVDLGYSCESTVLYDGEVIINDGSSDSLWTPQESVPPEALTITIDGTTYEGVPRQGGELNTYTYGDSTFNDYPFNLILVTPDYPWPAATLYLPNSGTYDVEIQAIGDASVSACFERAVKAVVGDVLFVDVTAIQNQAREMSVTYAEIRSALENGFRVVVRDSTIAFVGNVTGARSVAPSNYKVYVGMADELNSYRLLTFECANEEDKPVRPAS